MAEAHGQLTGRPAVCLGTRAVGGVQPRHRHPHGPPGLDADVRRRRPGRALVAGSRGIPGDRPGRLARAARQVGGRAAQLGGRRGDDDRGDAPGPDRPPGPVLLSLPEDLLDETMPDDAVVDATRPGVGARRPTTRSARSSSSSPRPSARSSSPVAAILRARTSTELIRFAELLQVPVIAAWRRADVISNDHPLYLGMTGFGAAPSVRERLDAADALLVIGSRLNEPTTYGYQVPRAGQRWAHVDLVPGAASGSTAPAITVAADAKAFLQGGQRAAPRACRPRRRARRHAAGQQQRRPRGLRGGVRGRRASRGTARASIPGARSRRSAGSCPTTPS